MNVGKAAIGLSKRPNLALVNGFGDRERVGRRYIGAVYVLVNLIADLLTIVVTPRLRTAGR